MPISKLTKSLLVTTALVFTACGQGEKAADNMTDKAKEKTAATAQAMKEKTVKMIEYTTAGQTDEDHLYLEEVLGETALDEVKAWNARSLDRLTADPRFKAMEAEALEILQSKDKIPYVSYRGGEVHNFWQDANHVRGIWRKSTLDSYLSENTTWETVLDFDKLSEDEGKNWVYKGNNCLPPDYQHCFVNLSDGGKDAVVRREFNAKTKRFVNDGFIAAESKGTIDWLDKNTAVIGVDFGENTMTESGYPRLAKLWKRGTPISEASLIGEGQKTDVGYWAGTFELADGTREIMASRSITFYDSEYIWFPRKDDKISEGVKLPIPAKINIYGSFKDQFLIQLNEDWRGYKTGDLVSFDIRDFMEDGDIDTVHIVFSPDEKSSMNGAGATKSKVLLSISSDVTSAAYAFDWDGKKWTSDKLDFPANGTVSIGATNDKEDVAFMSSESFLTPDTLWTYNTATGTKAKAKSLPNWFDADSMVSEQFFSTSPDGTKVPYFVVRQKDTKMDGTNKWTGRIRHCFMAMAVLRFP